MKHAKRKGDHEKYPSLEDFNRLKNEPGSVDSYLVAQPLEALSYVLEDTNYAYNIIDKTGDGLALLVTSICRAASQESSGLFSSHPWISDSSTGTVLKLCTTLQCAAHTIG